MVRKPVPAEYDIDYLVRDAFFSGITNGVIVEVGAARPDFLSISASFRTLGWKVNPEFCAVHRARGHDILEYAVSDTEADDENFFLSIPMVRTIWVEPFRLRAFLALA